MYSKLEEQMIVHNQICDKIMEERFSSEKHEDRWNDELFEKYTESKTRIKLLMELLLEQRSK